MERGRLISYSHVVSQESILGRVGYPTSTVPATQSRQTKQKQKKETKFGSVSSVDLS